MPGRKFDEMVCLKCTLFACDESSPECAYQLQLPTRTVQIARAADYAAGRRREQYRASKAKRRQTLFTKPQPATRTERRAANLEN